MNRVRSWARATTIVVLSVSSSGGCSRESDPGNTPARRAPKDAIPESVAVGGQEVIEGVATGHIRRNHTVASFSITKLPITVGQYKQCVALRGCSAPSLNTGFCGADFTPVPLDGPTYDLGDDALPVTCLSVDQASQYCAWVGARLPKPGEWQLAVRGKDVHRFAWGDSAPSCKQNWRVAFSQMQGSCCASDCKDVAAARTGQHSDGASPSGLLDVLSTRAEILGGDAESPFPSCQSGAQGCFAVSNSPGAIDALLPGSMPPEAALPAGFRCVWTEV